MAGMTNYMRNKTIDAWLRSVALGPPTSVFIGLASTLPTAASPGTALSGSGYARQEIVSGPTTWASTGGDTTTTNPSVGTLGYTSNNAVVDFGTAAAAWGTAAYWEAFDHVSAGNRLFWGTITDSGGTPTPRSIGIGDPVSFPISALRVEMT